VRNDDTDPQIVELYYAPDGSCPYESWLLGLKDKTTRHQIQARIARLRTGNPGRWKAVGTGIIELALDFGPGYRVYAGQLGSKFILLCGGRKNTQGTDIAAAKKYLADHLQQSTVQLKKGTSY
jgi:putative addiction module killer protein